MMFLSLKKMDKSRWGLLGLAVGSAYGLGWLLSPPKEGPVAFTYAGYSIMIILIIILFAAIGLLIFARPFIRKISILSFLSIFLASHGANLVFLEGYAVISEKIRKRRLENGHYQAVIEARKTNVDTYPRSYYQIMDIKDKKIMSFASGPSYSDIVFCNEGGYWARFKTDRYGFNNPDQIWDEDIKIAILGDSFTLGECVNQQDTWPSIVRQVYPGIINLSASGLGPVSMLALLREYVRDKKPNLVIWAYYAGNDLQEMHVESRGDVMSHYLQQDDFTYNLKALQNDIDRNLKGQFSLMLNTTVSSDQEDLSFRARDWIEAVLLLRPLRWTYDFQARKPRYVNDYKFEQANADFKPKDQAQELLALVERMQSEIETWGGQLIILYLTYYKTNVLGHIINIDKADFLVDAFRDRGISVIDTRDIFMKSGDIRQYYPLGDLYSHLNERGYQAVGKRVINYIKNHPDIEKLVISK